MHKPNNIYVGLATLVVGISIWLMFVALIAWPVMVLWGAIAMHFGIATMPYFIAILVVLLFSFLIGGKR